MYEVSVDASEDDGMCGVWDKDHKSPPDMTTKTATEKSMPPLPRPVKVGVGPSFAPPPKVRRRRDQEWAAAESASSAEDTEPRDACAKRWDASKAEKNSEEESLIDGAAVLPIGEVGASDQNPAWSSKAQASSDKPWNVPAVVAARLQAEHAQRTNVGIGHGMAPPAAPSMSPPPTPRSGSTSSVAKAKPSQAIRQPLGGDFRNARGEIHPVTRTRSISRDSSGSERTSRGPGVPTSAPKCKAGPSSSKAGREIKVGTFNFSPREKSARAELTPRGSSEAAV